MRNLSNLNNLSSLGAGGSSAWYRRFSYRLNNILPSLIHDYANNRYYNTVNKVQSFPFTSVRTTNATHFDSQGRLVWANANLFTNGSGNGGTASSLPTGWTTSIGAVPGGTVTVVGMRTSGGINYMSIRFQGTNDGTAKFPTAQSIAGASAPTAVLGESYTGSYIFSVVQDVYGNFSSCSPRCEIYELTGAGSYLISSNTVLTNTSTPTRVSHTRVLNNASVGRVNAVVAFTIQPSVTFDFTIEVGEFQLERTSVSSPLPYVSTTTAAVYKQRLDYNSATLEARGLLSEGASTNYLSYSRDKGTSFTAKTDITTAINVTDVSDVANAATRMTEGTAGTAILTADGSGVAAGSTITASILVKSTGASPVTWVRLGCTASGLTDGAEAWFNVSAGTLGTVSVRGAGTLQTARIVALRDGWYRLEVTSRPNGAYTVPCIFICSASADASATRVNNATYAIDYAQIEVASFATSIIPTYAATATRGADTFTLTTGAWLNQSELTAYLKYVPGADVAAARRLFTISDGTTNNLRGATRTTIRSAQNWSSIAAVQTFGPNTANTTTNLVSSKTVHLFGSAPTQAVCLNGGAVVTTVVATPTSGYTTLDIGKTVASSTANLNGWIQEFRVYPVASASNAQLQALTT